MLKNKWLIVALLLTIAVRLGFFLTEQPWIEQVKNDVILVKDALGYHSYAQKFSTNFSFSDVGDFSVRRTPGYPVYLAIVYRLAGERPWVAILLQIFFSAIIAHLIWRFAEEWFGRRIAFLSTLIYAFEPHAILYSNVLLPDTLYTLLTLGGLYLFLRGLKNTPTNYLVIIGSLCLAIAIYFKPIGQFFFIVPLIILCIKYIKTPKQIILPAILLCFGYAVVLSPWLTRNYLTYDHFSISDKGGDHLLRWVATYVEVAKTGNDPSTVRASFIEKANINGLQNTSNPFEKSAIQTQVAVTYIKENFGQYTLQHIKGVIFTFINLDTKRISELLGSKSNELSFHYFAAPDIWTATKQFLESKSITEITIGVYVALFIFTIYLFVLIGLVRAVNSKHYWAVFISLLVICYYLALVGPIGLARYKLPFMPLYLIFASYGVLHVYDFSRRHLSQKKEIVE